MLVSRDPPVDSDSTAVSDYNLAPFMLASEWYRQIVIATHHMLLACGCGRWRVLHCEWNPLTKWVNHGGATMERLLTTNLMRYLIQRHLAKHAQFEHASVRANLVRFAGYWKVFFLRRKVHFSFYMLSVVVLRKKNKKKHRHRPRKLQLVHFYW